MEQTIPRKDKEIERIAAYMAGIMDGEGTFSITKIRQNYTLRRTGKRTNRFGYELHINVYNTNLKLLEWIVQNVGGKLYEHKSRKGMKAHWKTKYMVFWSNKENKRELINLILPYLVIKKEQALVALQFIDLFHKNCPEKREQLRLKMIELNDSSQGRLKSVTTNTPNTSNGEDVKIESELTGDSKSDPGVIRETVQTV